MADAHNTPIYNLKAVVQDTGLKPDTVRAWERRYGMPSPLRAGSGHRLYSQRDIDTLKWLIARQDEGLNISRAVALWRQITAEGGDPLAAESGHDARLRAAGEPPTLAGEALPIHGDALASLRSAWIAACLNFDEQAAERTLTLAFALFPIEVVCVELIQWGLASIGEGWYQGRITVQQEHFASALALRRLEALVASTPPPTRTGRILVGCPPEEAHTFVPLMLSLLLRRRSWDVVYLGADVPVRSLEQTVRATRPDLVILAAQQLHTAASLLEMAEALQRERVPLAYGGLIFSQVTDLQQMVPGHYLGADLAGSVRTVEQIMVSPRVQAAVRRPQPEYSSAFAHFQQRRALVESAVWHELAPSGLSQRHLVSANASFGRNILAALALGSMVYLAPGIDWVEGLLVNHYQMPAERLIDYLEAYYRALVSHLDERGRCIVDWLGAILGIDPERSDFASYQDTYASRS